VLESSQIWMGGWQVHLVDLAVTPYQAEQLVQACLLLVEVELIDDWKTCVEPDRKLGAECPVMRVVVDQVPSQHQHYLHQWRAASAVRRSSLSSLDEQQ